MFEHTTFGVSFLKSKFNNIYIFCFILFKKGNTLYFKEGMRERKKSLYKTLLFPTLGKVAENQKGTI